MEAVTVFSATGGSIFVGQVILHSVFTPTFLTKENYSFRINLYVIRFTAWGLRGCVSNCFAQGFSILEMFGITYTCRLYVSVIRS